MVKMPIHKTETASSSFSSKSELSHDLPSSYKDLAPYETHTNLLREITASFHRFHQARQFVDLCHNKRDSTESDLTKKRPYLKADLKDSFNSQETVIQPEQIIFEESDFTEEKLSALIKSYSQKISETVGLYQDKKNNIIASKETVAELEHDVENKKIEVEIAIETKRSSIKKLNITAFILIFYWFLWAFGFGVGSLWGILLAYITNVSVVWVTSEFDSDSSGDLSLPAHKGWFIFRLNSCFREVD
ncbi:hypothetical protein [Leptothoe spongobia]|uniref:Uncharacterized protein n=1 Tax=Leptothoe spongobia TAU-MAC 1115 TaxID=1967444 RepID=A0A947GKP7_9CYAN|nr:hypothetical protein [Leptothoe spongobia]MBT9317053.1 hypothetical protein [Leptothoe spongobia TAU-MAC 1115]